MSGNEETRTESAGGSRIVSPASLNPVKTISTGDSAKVLFGL